MLKNNRTRLNTHSLVYFINACAFTCILLPNHTPMIQQPCRHALTPGRVLNHFQSLSLRTGTGLSKFTTCTHMHTHASNQYILYCTARIDARGDQSLRGIQYAGCRLCVTSHPELYIHCCQSSCLSMAAVD